MTVTSEAKGTAERRWVETQANQVRKSARQVYYLGNVVSVKGVATDPVNVEAINEWEPSKNVKSLQAFLGTAGYYRQYLLDFATVAQPLTRLVSGDNACVWSTKEQTAFQ